MRWSQQLWVGHHNLLCQSLDGFLVVGGGAVVGALTAEEKTLYLALTEASVHDRTAGLSWRGGKLDPVSGIKYKRIGGRLQWRDDQLEGVPLCETAEESFIGVWFLEVIKKKQWHEVGVF